MKRPLLALAEKPPRPGEWIILASSAPAPDGGMGISLRPSVLSSTTASVRCYGVWRGNLMAFEAQCEAGTACAPVMNEDGDVTGVVLNSLRNGVTEGVYALPAERLQPILRQLLKGRTTRAGWLGLAVFQMGNSQRLKVLGVLDESPGYKGGLRPGDELLEIDGRKISRPEIFTSTVAETDPGDNVTIRIRRGKTARRVKVQLGRRPLRILQANPELCRWPPRDQKTDSTPDTVMRLQRGNRHMRLMLRKMQAEIRDLKKELESRTSREKENTVGHQTQDTRAGSGH